MTGTEDPFGVSMLGFDPYAAAAQAQADYAATMASFSSRQPGQAPGGGPRQRRTPQAPTGPWASPEERTGPQQGPPGGYDPRFSGGARGPRMPQTRPNPMPAAPPPQQAAPSGGNHGGVRTDYGNGTIEYNDGTVEYANEPGGPVHTRRNADGSVDYNLDQPQGPWRAGADTTGDQPRTANTVAPLSYNAWSGWNMGKLQNPDWQTVKYKAGRLFQELSGGSQNVANDFRGRLQEVADEYNRRYGGNAFAVGDDKIDFGDGAGPVDVITSWGDWWWGNEAAPGSFGAATGEFNSNMFNPYDEYGSQQYGNILDSIMQLVNGQQGYGSYDYSGINPGASGARGYNPVPTSGGGSRNFTTGPQAGRVSPYGMQSFGSQPGQMSAVDYGNVANYVQSSMNAGYLPSMDDLIGAGYSRLEAARIRQAASNAGGDLSAAQGPVGLMRGNNVAANIGASRSGAQPGPQIPSDLVALRQQLADIFASSTNRGYEMYPGTFGVDAPMIGAAGQMAAAGPGAVGRALQPAANALNLSIPFALDIARTGGVPTQQLISSLGSIRTAGQTALTNNLAQIREQYGASGVGGGADVNAALARGAAEAEQATEAQQSSLLTSVLQQAAQTQLGGVGALQAAGAGFGNLAGTLGQAYGQAGSTMASLAGIQGQLGQFSRQLQYNDWLRRINPSSWLQMATGFSTAFPPVMQPTSQGPSTGATLGAAGLAAGGSILAAILPWLIMSDVNLKEDIRPVDDVLPALLSMPISKWRYKGDDIVHIGPMAQDFNKAFGVGDDRHIHLVDAVGVSLKALAEIGRDVKALRKAKRA